MNPANITNTAAKETKFKLINNKHKNNMLSTQSDLSIWNTSTIIVNRPNSVESVDELDEDEFEAIDLDAEDENDSNLH